MPYITEKCFITEKVARQSDSQWRSKGGIRKWEHVP